MANIRRRYIQIDKLVSNGEAFEDQDIIEQERLHIFKVVQREREKIKSLLSIRMRFKNL